MRKRIFILLAVAAVLVAAFWIVRARRANGTSVYRFAEVEREQADLARYRASVDLAKLETGGTVFDSGA